MLCGILCEAGSIGSMRAFVEAEILPRLSPARRCSPSEYLSLSTACRGWSYILPIRLGGGGGGTATTVCVAAGCWAIIPGALCWYWSDILLDFFLCFREAVDDISS